MRPLPGHIRTARKLIDAGSGGVIGHRPHVPQSIEVYRNRPVVYSPGNFLAGYYNSGYRNNIGVTLNSVSGRIFSMDIHSIAGKNLCIRFQPGIVSGEEGRRDMDYLEKISRCFSTVIVKRGDGSGRIVSRLCVGRYASGFAASSW